MPLPHNIADRMVADDGLNLRNWGYATLLVVSYILLVLVIGVAVRWCS